MQKIVLASNNAGKLAEFKALFEPLNLQVIPQGELEVTEAEEPFGTFVENALAKARHASASTGLPAVADDSGLCVAALGGAPGVYSARYAAMNSAGQGDGANNDYLLKQLIGESQRKACFVSVLVYVNSPSDPRPLIAEGVWWGEIAQQAAGANGFGYDPLFYIPELKKSSAELLPAEKNTYSHRAQALQLLVKQLAAAQHS